MGDNNTFTVEKGHTFYKDVYNRLDLLDGPNNQPTHKQVNDEMLRIAILNGYSSIEEFNHCYYGQTGKTYSIDSTPVQEEQKYKTSLEIEIENINSMSDNKEKIIQWNMTHGRGKYAVVDKEQCTITLYNQDGSIVKDEQGRDIILPVGVGKYKGDNLMFGYATPKDDPLHEKGRYTAAGEFCLDELNYWVRSEDSIINYGSRVMDLKGDNRGEKSAQMAFHQVPETICKDSRTAALQNDKNPDGTLKKRRNTADNRMSYGCVNLLPEDYDLLYQSGLTEGHKVYILPEEKDNALVLERTNGELKFVQINHKDQVRSVPAEQASKVTYDVNTSKADSVSSWATGLAYKIYGYYKSIVK